jgi:hypothetical protein
VLPVWLDPRRMGEKCLSSSNWIRWGTASLFTHRTIDPALTVIFAGSNAKLLILTVFSDTRFAVGVGMIDVAGGDTDVCMVTVAVGWTGVADWVHPLATTRTKAMPRIMRPVFIHVSQLASLYNLTS